MNRGTGVRSSALALAAAIAMAAEPARAQLYPAANQSLAAFPDPLARSPRLVGMGRLTMVIPDAHNRITLWDFAGIPAGLGLNDSTTTLDVRPLTGSVSSARNINDLLARGERQDFAGRGTRIGYEAWRRIPGLSVFGAVGDVGQRRTDRPYSRDVEVRSLTLHPNVLAAVGGRMPYFWSPRLHGAIRLFTGLESQNEEYRLYTRNAAGEYIDRDGVLGSPPDLFTPDEIDVETVGGGGSIAYVMTSFLTAAVSVDGLRHKIQGLNDADRYISERSETRPVAVGQAALIGRFGPSFEWGADGRAWTSKSTETWVFSVSTNTGGAGAPPFAGRGDYQRREEKGTSLRTRARYTVGAIELGGSLSAGTRKVTLTPPPANDRNSFNAFLNSIFYRDRADSTVYPDSVVFNESEDRFLEVAGGASWRLAKGILGGEVHSWRGERDVLVSGFKENDPGPAPWSFTQSGPEPRGWDVRGGVEYRLHAALTGRAGYIHCVEDLDELTEQNERVANTVTAGFGFTPPTTHWRFEANYVLEWWKADFGTPREPRGTRQLLAAQIGWVF